MESSANSRFCYDRRMSTTPPVMPSKQRGPLFWILVGLGVFALLGAIVIGITGFTVLRTAREIQNSDNPDFAAAKLFLRLNSNLELISEDPADGSITVRNKKTGDVSTMVLDAETKRFHIETRSGKSKMEIQDGKAVIKSPDATMVIGSQAGTLPSWLPAYPGTQPTGTMVAETPSNKSSTFAFKTADTPEQVLTFYKEKLEAAGFEILTAMIQATGGMVTAQDSASQRQVVVTTSPGGETVLSVTEIR